MDYQSRTTFPAIDSDASNILEIPNPTGTPERRLLLAILERAILDFVGNDEREVSEADAWLFGDDLPSDNDDEETDRFAVFSFTGICRELDLNPSDISTKIRAMPRRGNRRVAPWYFPKEAAISA